MKSRFWDKVASNYDNNTDKVFKSANEKVLTRITKYYNEEYNVLEIGCGTGYFTVEVAKAVKVIDAFDISEKMLQIARAKSEEYKIDNINWILGDIQSLDKQKKYDIILAFNLLLYLEQPKLFIQTVYDRLPEGGYFITVTDCLQEKFRIINPIQKLLSKLGILPRMNFWVIKNLTDMMKQVGFTIVEEENVHTIPVNYFVVARK